MLSLTIKSSEQIQSLIESIERNGQEEVSTAGAIALLNLMPFAGGAVASVIGEYASRRKLEKVCDVLSDLNGRLESHDAEPEKHLSKDQIIEIIHETLQTVTTASDQEKGNCLKKCFGIFAAVRRQLRSQATPTSGPPRMHVVGTVGAWDAI